MPEERPDILQGTLDLLILRTLRVGAMHGWSISRRIQQVSDDVLNVQQGSLYPSLHRLERRGWIASEWGASENNRRAKFYRLTEQGEAQLEVETERWQRLSAAVGQVLQNA
ncbi:MAG: PadR family transcriptional regulator [Acidobacteriota bacterium]